MRRKYIHISLLLLLFGALHSFTVDQKEKLKGINSQITAINTKLEKINREKKSLLNDIHKLELQYEKEIIESNKLELQLIETNRKIKNQEKEKKKHQLLIEESKNNVKEVIRIMYKMGGNTNIKLFLRVDSVDELFNNYRLFITLVNFKSTEISKIKTSIRKLDTIKAQLENEYAKVQGYRTSKIRRVRNMRSLKYSKLNYIKKINSDKKQYQQLLEELSFEASQINDVITGKRVKSSLKVLNLERIKGRLGWPLQGKIISTFGKKRSDRYDTYTLNNGIEISPTGSDKVKAVYPGDVVFADYFKGKGNLIIIQHSRDLYTLYGHCDKLLKQRGDHIKRGEIIAIAGDTGFTSKKSLYFEVRRNLKAKDPLKWLKKR